MILFLIGYFWWPLLDAYLRYFQVLDEWWRYIDWLLIGIFLFMSVMLMAGADLKVDAWIIFVGFGGGLVIESWGTQTELWTYYTMERPPLWIIPAWPIASLSIDRMVRVLDHMTGQKQRAPFEVLYWLIFPAFFALMLIFVWPTVDQSMTIMALFMVAAFILTPTDHRMAVLTFVAGIGLGYFLELWGTTRLCWTYYTGEQPPFFAVMAHGMAAVAFWRTVLLVKLATSLSVERVPLLRGLFGSSA
ncbi:MAG: hypothetical protein GYB68_11790 [Chloroflexi bacterium]|nr:hypothetical protein [Chloroflexota bacterium]